MGSNSGCYVGAQPIRTFIDLDFASPSSINDVQIGLDMDLTGLTNYYTKTETDNNLLLKADKTITYTKTEVDNRIANLVDSAPAALNTLKELATALGNDQKCLDIYRKLDWNEGKSINNIY